MLLHLLCNNQLRASSSHVSPQHTCMDAITSSSRSSPPSSSRASSPSSQTSRKSSRSAGSTGTHSWARRTSMGRRWCSSRLPPPAPRCRTPFSRRTRGRTPHFRDVVSLGRPPEQACAERERAARPVRVRVRQVRVPSCSRCVLRKLRAPGESSRERRARACLGCE